MSLLLSLVAELELLLLQDERDKKISPDKAVQITSSFFIFLVKWVGKLVLKVKLFFECAHWQSITKRLQLRLITFIYYPIEKNRKESFITNFTANIYPVHFDLQQIASATMILFAVIDILGAIPIVIDLSSRLGEIHALKATLISGGIMIGFLFLGQSILSLIGIDIRSFAIAGAIIIFILGMEMVLGIRIFKEEGTSSVSVVPVAFPLIAGTGTLTTLLSIRAEFRIENIIAGILINLVFVFVVLRNTKYLEKLLGQSGIIILRKVFGVTLLAIAIKLFSTNIKAF